ncbi:acetyltransferase [Escherichia coli]|nr:acetyltransferase [Escherichia coli]
MCIKKKLKLIKRYGLYGGLRLLKDIFLTKFLFCSNVRIIRFPCYIRKDGSVSFGKGFTSGVGLRVDAFMDAVVSIGENVQINDYVHIAAINNVIIGRDTLIASKVFISDHNHGIFSKSDIHSSPTIIPSSRPLESAPVHIGERVWIGENVTILPGACIGNGVVIGANSVVRGEIPNNVIIAGVPAKIVKKYNYERMQWERI